MVFCMANVPYMDPMGYGMFVKNLGHFRRCTDNNHEWHESMISGFHHFIGSFQETQC